MTFSSDPGVAVKATTAGGIIQSMTAAKIAADSIINKTDYEKAWKKKLGRELWTHLMIRKVLDNFSDRDYNDLINYMKKEKVKKILETESRDRPLGLMSKLLLAQPKLLKFGFRIFG